MKVNRLALKPYGSLLDTSIELGDGLTVVHGLNEAGKSTVLAAYADLLCGIKRNTNMNFLASRAALRIHSKITRDDGSAVDVIRTSKNSPNDLLDAATSQPIDNGTRHALTQGLSHDSLMARFGLDHSRLIEGGARLMKGAGDLADIIFEARTGTDVRVLVDELDKRCTELFTARANSASLLNKANTDREQLASDLKATMSTAEAVEVAILRRNEAERELNRIRCEAALRRTEHTNLSQLEGSWPFWLQYQNQRDALEKIEASGPRMSEEHLQTVTTTTARLGQIDNDINRETDVAKNARRESAGLVYNEDLLAAQPAVDGLARDKQAADSARSRAIEAEVRVTTESAALREKLIRLDIHTDDDPLTAFTSIAVPDDKCADLNSLAADRDRLDEALHKAQHAVREATDQLQDAQRPNRDDVGATDNEVNAQPVSVSSARTHRDLLWSHVRSNWLAGDPFPAEFGSRPTDLASAYEKSVDGADNAADQFAVASASDARVGERRSALERAERSLTQAVSALSDWESRWDAATAEARLPLGIGVAGWRERAKLLTEAADISESIRAAETARLNDAAVAAKWDAAASRLASDMGRSVAVEQLSTWFDGIKSAYEESKSNQRAVEVHRINQIRATERTAELRTEKLKLEESLDQVAAANKVNRGQLANIAERTRLHSDAVAALKEPEGQLQARHPGTGLDELASEFTLRDREQLRVDLDAARDAMDSSDEEVNAAQEELARAKTSLDDLTGRTGAESLQQELSQSTAHVLELAEEYAITRIMHYLLTQELRTYFESHQNPVLERAGAYLSRLTNGRYTGLRSEGEGTERSLIVVGADNNDYEPSSLSEGTASQLYLSLSLAGVLEVQKEREQAGQERVPLMLDDVLIAFDDDRAAAALNLLEEIGREQQIVLFTHHDSVREVASAKKGLTTVFQLPVPEALG